MGLEQIIAGIQAVAVFMLVIALWLGVVLAWSAIRRSREQRIQGRLGLDGEGIERVLHLWQEGTRISTSVHGRAVRVTPMAAFGRWMRRAGIPDGHATVASLIAGAGLGVTFLVAVALQNVLLGLAAGAAVLVIFRIVMANRITKREKTFEQQFVDSIELAARSLRAGHPLLAAFELVATEMAPPISHMFDDICRKHGMGAPLDAVLTEAADSQGNEDMRLFATSVSIQLRTGGNLADVIDRIAKVIRDRLRLNRRVRILQAQTQMSKRILLALPFFIFLLLSILNPDYMSPLYERTAGHIMLGIAVGQLLLGAWLMNRMAKISY